MLDVGLPQIVLWGGLPPFQSLTWQSLKPGKCLSSMRSTKLVGWCYSPSTVHDGPTNQFASTTRLHRLEHLELKFPATCTYPDTLLFLQLFGLLRKGTKFLLTKVFTHRACEVACVFCVWFGGGFNIHHHLREVVERKQDIPDNQGYEQTTTDIQPISKSCVKWRKRG